MFRRTSVIILVLIALVGAVSLGSTAAENPAAWEATAAYLSSLPEGFNGIKGEVLKAKLDAGEQIFLLDVRQPDEFAAGRIDGAVNVPIRDLPKNLAKLPQEKNAPIVVICASAVRSGYATMALNFKGYGNVKHLAAGFMAGWQKAGYPVVK